MQINTTDFSTILTAIRGYLTPCKTFPLRYLVSEVFGPETPTKLIIRGLHELQCKQSTRYFNGTYIRCWQAPAELPETTALPAISVESPRLRKRQVASIRNHRRTASRLALMLEQVEQIRDELHPVNGPKTLPAFEKAITSLTAAIERAQRDYAKACMTDHASKENVYLNPAKMFEIVELGVVVPAEEMAGLSALLSAQQP